MLNTECHLGVVSGTSVFKKVQAILSLLVDAYTLRDRYGPRLASLAEAAEILGMPESAVRDHVETDEWPSVRTSDQVLVDLDQVLLGELIGALIQLQDGLAESPVVFPLAKPRA